MKKWQEIPEFINGFKIVKDLGIKELKRLGIVICKVCHKQYETDLWKLHRRKSCGCYKHDQLGILPKIINDFKIIKDLGHDGKRRALVECKQCKRNYKVQVWTLKNRKHCGCMITKPFKCSYRKSHPRLINIYKCMKARCYNEKDISYKYYGKKGIIVCKEWLENADDFCIWALKNGYKIKLTIDRIDNNKNYEPENCRWATYATQERNREFCKLNMELARLIRIDSKNMKYKDLSEKYKVSYETIRKIILNKTWKE